MSFFDVFLPAAVLGVSSTYMQLVITMIRADTTHFGGAIAADFASLLACVGLVLLWPTLDLLRCSGLNILRMTGSDETFLILWFIAFVRRMSPKALIPIDCVVDHLLCKHRDPVMMIWITFFTSKSLVDVSGISVGHAINAKSIPLPPILGLDVVLQF